MRLFKCNSDQKDDEKGRERKKENFIYYYINIYIFEMCLSK